jgi:hypothetical protein
LSTLIEFFAVPPSQDEAFLADWQRERGAHGATLYRAIRDDTPTRFVSLSPGDAYELVHEDGDVEGDGGVIQITTFAAPHLSAWRRLHDIETGRRGYLGARLFQSSAGAGFVAITRWSSPLMVFRTAQQPEYQQTAFASVSALYTRTNNALRGSEGAI